MAQAEDLGGLDWHPAHHLDFRVCKMGLNSSLISLMRLGRAVVRMLSKLKTTEAIFLKRCLSLVSGKERLRGQLWSPFS